MHYDFFLFLLFDKLDIMWTKMMTIIIKMVIIHSDTYADWYHMGINSNNNNNDKKIKKYKSDAFTNVKKCSPKNWNLSCTWWKYFSGKLLWSCWFCAGRRLAWKVFHKRVKNTFEKALLRMNLETNQWDCSLSRRINIYQWYYVVICKPNSKNTMK